MHARACTEEASLADGWEVRPAALWLHLIIRRTSEAACFPWQVPQVRTRRRSSQANATRRTSSGSFWHRGW
ncbi:hypothetical protein EYF80_059362 [Liparis tanakae]|uniref:Uncharacterized protein n=1 Tax=Liparis tanakae TaxID=230148 RepID=A0A4Z2ENK5_9TELE|nr:hypothetical protein EYF80_059362 [Liparis tanakae]